MTWFNPDKVADKYKCDECNLLTHEDDLTEMSSNVWFCTDCLDEEARNRAALQEMADDDKAHAMRERLLGL